MDQCASSVPLRSEVDPADTWDLSSLYADDASWESDFRQWESRIAEFEAHRGRLSQSAESLAACLQFQSEFDRQGERLGVYAFLKSAEDAGDSRYQAMLGRYRHAAARAAQAASFIEPEILAIDPQQMAAWIETSLPALYRLQLTRILRRRAHTLSAAEERLLAMQVEMSCTADTVFRQLNDVDLDFGTVADETGRPTPLTHSTFSSLLRCTDRKVRAAAFHTYYKQYSAHRHTLTAILAGGVHRDVYYARARNFNSSLEAALFPDQAPRSVYENLIAAVRGRLPDLHRYYELRRRKMRLPDLHHYDLYAPIVPDLKTHIPWNEAVETVLAAVQPLGTEYCETLAAGLRGRWCDRYENRGKHSGAFSCGSYDGDPYILMNYRPDVFEELFTLAHEAGHSMHSFYSARRQPYLYYDYAILAAEVASTFNEQLLAEHLLGRAGNDALRRAAILSRQIDAVRGTIFRQTMFAEFEMLIHADAEAGTPLTLEYFTETYHRLLVDYFGPQFVLDPELDLECFRIPHFYRAFYVYKYATGMSAALALADAVLSGEPAARQRYLDFLAAGCSKDPIDLLRDAGVNLAQPEPVHNALQRFAGWVDQLDALLAD